MNFQKPREIALRVLQSRERESQYTEDLLDREFNRSSLNRADRGLAQELVYGTVRSQATLDWLIDRKAQASAPKPAVRILLRLGLYQIFFLDRIPDHAAVHETVELAKRNGFGKQAGFINAILRGYIREKEITSQLLESLKSENPAIGFSHPAWLVQRWMHRFGNEKTRQLLDWNNRPPKIFARVNTLRIDPGQLLSTWREKENVEYDFVRRDWFGENLVFELKQAPPIATLQSFRQGWFYVQDPSTLLAVTALDPKPGERLLDLCAAPGGKAGFAAQLMQNQGELIAEDLQPDRLAMLNQNLERLGVTCATSRLVASDSNDAAYDRVLIDAPCSNTGVIRRRVDLRWRIRPEELDRLVGTQRDLLVRAAAQLKPGGTLVYSTCSLEPEENDLLVSEFLRDHPSFELLSQRQLLPFEDQVDGAYVAVMRRA